MKLIRCLFASMGQNWGIREIDFIIQNKFHVQHNSSWNLAPFVKEFDGENKSTYFLAPNKSEAQEWIKALENASYTKLKQKYELLIKQQNSSADEASIFY